MLIAVTGASGFIGRYVVESLIRQDIDVILLVHKNRNVPEHPRVRKVIVFDLTDQSTPPFQRTIRPDALIHLAWSGLPNYKSSHHIETELPSQIRFLEDSIDSGIQHIVVSGTCLEYGMQSGELSENILPQPTTPYGIAKDFLKRHLEALQQIRSFSLSWLRLFYLFGRHQSERSLYSQFVRAVENHDTFFDMSGGEQVRDFLPATDAAKLIAETAIARINTGPMNICSGSPVSVRALVENWKQQFHSNIHLNLGKLPYCDYEPMQFWGSREKLDRFLGSRSMKGTDQP